MGRDGEQGERRGGRLGVRGVCGAGRGVEVRCPGKGEDTSLLPSFN